MYRSDVTRRSIRHRHLTIATVRDWLLEQRVHLVAMEATGIYWLPLDGVLEAAHLEVRMVNGRQTRNLPGRKTDMADCPWGATLHIHGLLPITWPRRPAACN